MLSSLVLVGCPYDSPTPLGPASEGRIDPLLLGTWRCTGGEGGEPSLVSFRQFDETQYYVVVGSDIEGDESATFRVYSSLVRDASFLNVQELKDDTSHSERRFVFLSYSFPDADALAVEELDLDRVQAAQDSGLEALQVLEAALDDPDALVPSLDCVREREGE